MEKSTQMDCKKRTGEINTSPVPAALKDQMLRSGLWICSYYEAVRCSCLFSRKNLETQAFPFFVITQMLNHKGFYCTSSSQIQKTPQGALMVAVPGKMIKYGSFEEYFTEDSIAFMGNTAEIMMRNGVISHGLYDLGTERRLLPIINKLREATMPAFLEANNMLCSLLFEIHNSTRNRNSRISTRSIQFDSLLREIRRDMSRWWTVSDMAAFCNISENYLRRLFQEQTGASPKHYIDNLRITRAAEILTSTDRSIADIASSLGYLDTYHFIRRFSQVMGIPPARYRRQFHRIGR